MSNGKAIHTVKSYKINGEEFKLFTDKTSFTRKFDTAKEFFTYWYETKENLAMDIVQEKVKEPENTSVSIYEKESSLADSLISILKDNIARVQKNGTYIAQAKAVNNDINSIINIVKLKMDMYKQIKGRPKFNLKPDDKVD